MLMRPGAKPEPISIPVPASPSIGIPLPSANMDTAEEDAGPSDCSVADSCEALPGGSFGAAAATAASKAAARQRDFERLSAALAHSEIRPEELRTLENIGHGSSGSVSKVLHVPSDSVLALKVIPVNADEIARKSILLELKTLHESSHPAIVSFYGAFYREGAVHIALEYMDASLLDVTRAVRAPIPEHVLAAIISPVLDGLSYLHRQRHTIHRDIKPSNLLVDAAANIKIADFGVSGELSCTLSKCASWVGTMHYMSPERITAGPYSYDSDVWSLGITLLELATGSFPYAPNPRPQRLGFWDLLDFIVESPPPVPPPSSSPHFHSFCVACLQKAPEQRASSFDLLQHPLLSSRSECATAAVLWIRDALARVPPRGQAAGAQHGVHLDQATDQGSTQPGWNAPDVQAAANPLPWPLRARTAQHQPPPWAASFTSQSPAAVQSAPEDDMMSDQ